MENSDFQQNKKFMSAIDQVFCLYFNSLKTEFEFSNWLKLKKVKTKHYCVSATKQQPFTYSGNVCQNNQA